MTRFPVRSLALLLLAAVLVPGVSPAAPRGGKNAAIPSAPEKKRTEAPPGDLRVRQLRETRDRLKLFLSGRKPIDVPPEALFTVDLADEEAVARRVKELSARILPGPAPERGAAPSAQASAPEPVPARPEAPALEL